MIKIGFRKIEKVKIDYPDLITDMIAKRLTILKTSLTHIHVAPNSNDDNLVSFKAVTAKIINYFQPKSLKIPATSFVKDDYDPTVSNYVAIAANQAKINAINFNSIIQLIDHLLAKNNRNLRLLLICSPERLYKFNSLLMSHFNITSGADKFVLGLGFDWDLHSEISTVIKHFFHEQRQVVHCPYCNINRAFYSELPGGEVSSSFSLDHFYHKAESPLLTFSLFNLVPADDICNGPNVKGQIRFYYDYHLNPYEAGMDCSRMVFLPKVSKIGNDPSEIVLNLIPPPNTRKYQQMVGNFLDIDETRNFGNINVFNLKNNYNQDFVLETAGRIQRKCEALFRSRNSLKNFLKDMKLKLNANSYHRFYKDEFGTEFLPENFHRFCYSKLARDIHDNVLERDKTSDNDDIKKITKKSPA